MSGEKPRSPTGAIVSAVVGGLILLWPAMELLLGSGVIVNAPRGLSNNVVTAIFTVGACLAFASAGFACRRPFVAGVLAALAVLSVLSDLVYVYVGLQGLVPGDIPAEAFVIIITVISIFVFCPLCVLAALLNFNRWGKERQRDDVADDAGGEERSE